MIDEVGDKSLQVGPNHRALEGSLSMGSQSGDKKENNGSFLFISLKSVS